MKRLLTLFLLLFTPAHAQNYSAMQAEGFGDAAKILQDMTPEQRAEVMKRAQAQAAELQKLTPAQQQELLHKLHEENKKIDYSKVDAKTLDTSKNNSTPLPVQTSQQATSPARRPGYR